MNEKFVPIRLSHSTLEMFDRCERLFQLEKLLVTDSVRDESADLSLGTAFGVGVADYLVDQNPEQALYRAWLAYWPEIETEKKSIPHLIALLSKSFPYLDTMLRDYEVLHFNGKPAVELSFRVNINAHYYYVGYMDVVLQNRYDKTAVVVDAKSTALQLLDLSPVYQNSGQGLSYSIVLDRILGEKRSNYAVGYFVGQLGKDFKVEIKPLIFSKTLLDRLNWFIQLGMDIKRLEFAEEMGFYPRRGGACLKYNRPCKHFGTCTLSSMDIPRKREDDIIEYDFVFDLEELIDDHISRINS